jgi:hypothetical protein
MSRIFFKSLLGLLYLFDLDINDVGSMSRSLYAYNNPEYDDAQVLKWQSAQIYAISLTNFGGRLLIGTHIASPFCLTFFKFLLN